MLLSYTVRLACITLFSIGIIQLALEVLFWIASPLIVQALKVNSARCKERVFLALQVLPHFLACLLAGAFLVPQYVRGEANQLSEKVGLICILFAVVVLSRYLIAAARGFLLSVRTNRWLRGRSKPVTLSGARAPVVFVPEEEPLLAIIGVLSPNIVISKRLVDEVALSPAALDVALAHENAHLGNFDHLKLFIVSCLPNLHLHSQANPSMFHRWRSYAEVAADDEAVGESSSRAVLLAETILTLARFSSNKFRGLSTALLPHEADLKTRISLLLQERPLTSNISFPRQSIVIGGVAILIAAASILFVMFLSCWNILAEHVLHLG